MVSSGGVGGGESAGVGVEAEVFSGVSSLDVVDVGSVISSGGETRGSMSVVVVVGGSGGGSNGPNQPSCSPRTYSFQVCRPMIRSPCKPAAGCSPAFVRISSTISSGGPSVSTRDFSPFFFRNFRTLSARPARTSPSRRPSITSQSIAAATKTGFTYSLKYSLEVRRPSPGGAERTIVSFRGI